MPLETHVAGSSTFANKYTAGNKNIPKIAEKMNIRIKNKTNQFCVILTLIKQHLDVTIIVKTPS